MSNDLGKQKKKYLSRTFLNPFLNSSDPFQLSGSYWLYNILLWTLGWHAVTQISYSSMSLSYPD